MSKIQVIVDILIAIKLNILFAWKMCFELLIINAMHFRKRCKTERRLDGNIVVITGGNTGIGKKTALQLSLRGAKIIIGCRDLEKAETAVQDIRTSNRNADICVLRLDLSSLTSVRQFAKSVAEQESKIDILINNAGIMMCPEWTTEDGFEMQFGTNYLGHFLLIHCLMDLLKRSPKARIINISSVCHILGKIHFSNINLKNSDYSPLKAYSQSKLAIVLLSRELAKRLGQKSNVNVYCLHPGIIKTEITRHFPTYLYLIVKHFMISIESGTQTTLFCALEECLDNESGFYYDNCKRIDNMVSQAMDDNSAKKLIDLSYDLIKLEDNLQIKTVLESV